MVYLLLSSKCFLRQRKKTIIPGTDWRPLCNSMCDMSCGVQLFCLAYQRWHRLVSECTLCFQWARYMCCDGSPDPAVQREINTYISIQLERREAHGEVEVVLRDIQLDLAVCCNHNFDYMVYSAYTWSMCY